MIQKKKSDIKNDTRESFIKKDVAFDMGLHEKPRRREGFGGRKNASKAQLGEL